IAKSLGSLTVCKRTYELYTSGKYKLLSEVVTDRDVVNACLRFADDHRYIVEPACGATLAAIYSGTISALQAKGQLPASLSSVLVIVCGGAIVTLDMLQKWKEQFSL
ncbi:hypothetical protein BaRGS_00031342, partial [Batillaria attramentaria]